MSVKSKFERGLSFRTISFAIKIPDAGKSRKPFDYVIGVPYDANGRRRMEFVAIEAKKADGWSLPKGKWQPHQITALDFVENMSMDSAWVAIGYLDLPKMKQDWKRKKLVKKIKAWAYLVPWWYFKEHSVNMGLHFSMIVDSCEQYKLVREKVRTQYLWVVPPTHPLLENL